MANPVVTALVADTWTAVLPNTTGGIVWIHRTTTNQYLYTYRETGGAAPTDDNDARMVVSNKIVVSHSSPIDVYVKSVGVAGSVMVVS